MSSLNSILTTANRALQAYRAATDVTAHNVANASSPGFSRQRPSLTASNPIHTPEGVLGTGVELEDVQRVRDELLDRSLRRERGLAADARSRSDLLGRVEQVLGEPSENGLAADLDALFSAFSELATNPASRSARTVVRQNARRVVDRIGELARSFAELRSEGEDRVGEEVRRVNDLLGEVADLNRAIVAAESGGNTAGDLRDAQDRALDALSEQIPITVSRQENGSVGVSLRGISLVDARGTVALAVGTNGGDLEITAGEQDRPVSTEGGALGGLVTFLNQDLNDYRGRLDALAEALVTEVNAIHETGTNPLGNTAVPFFDPGGTTASTLSLSAEVDANVDAIAAGTGDSFGQYLAGANDVALDLAALRSEEIGSLGTTYLGQITSLITDVGSELRSARSAAEAHGTLADQAEIRRQEVSGVSVDEEMIRLIQFQAAYSAAARLVTAADEMMQEVLRL